MKGSLYFDTSYLFRLYSTEPGAEAVQGLLHRTDSIAIAIHGRAEMAATIHRKLRESALAPAAVREIRAQFKMDIAGGLIQLLPISPQVLDRLDDILEKAPASTYIRAADALHLACAAEHGFQQVHSNDRHFLSAAPIFGLEGLNVISGR